MSYGEELILDLKDCDPETFTRSHIQEFFVKLCEQIHMKREDLHFWDYEDASEELLERARQSPHLYGVSAVQFISTSSIVIHALPLLRACYINIFSCSPFNHGAAKQYAWQFFGGEVERFTSLTRG